MYAVSKSQIGGRLEKISVSVPDEVAVILSKMAAHSGQSMSSLASGLLSQATYDEASRRFKGLNYLNAIAKIQKNSLEKDESNDINN